jgi:hypothetical protein
MQLIYFPIFCSAIEISSKFIPKNFEIFYYFEIFYLSHWILKTSIMMIPEDGKKSRHSSCGILIRKSLLNRVLQYPFLSSSCKCYNTESRRLSAVLG